MTVATDAWLASFAEEYLDEFICGGGATVKFLVGDERERRAAAEGLAREGAKRGYLVTTVDSRA